MIPPRQVCTFQLGERTYAIDVARVRSVLSWRPVHRVPLAPPTTAGLINLRGEILLAIDLRAVLGLGRVGPEERPMSVVVDTRTGPATLLVDGIGDVLEPDPAAFEPRGQTPGTEGGLLAGVFKLPGKLVPLVDPDAVGEAAA